MYLYLMVKLFGLISVFKDKLTSVELSLVLKAKISLNLFCLVKLDSILEDAHKTVFFINF